MRLAFVLGTRPEIIKTAPILHAARERGLEFVVVHSGQHYDEAMDGAFFRDLGLPEPEVRLEAGGKPYAAQVGYLKRALTEALERLRPDAVVLQGDTVTVLCGAFAANALGLPIVHHEAGLRSRDPRMSEEYHRIITDHLSTLLCAPTPEAVRNLKEEGIAEDRILLTGNTIADAVSMFADRARERSDVLTRLGLAAGGYFLLTLHRAENVDDRERLTSAVAAVARVTAEHPDRPLVLPVHPRVAARMEAFGLSWPAGVRAIAPLGYLDMLRLLDGADLVLTDSGGLQEECAILGVPCVTLRDSTERPETVAAGVNVIAGLEPARVTEGVSRMRGKRHTGLALYGAGSVSVRILDGILERVAVRDRSAA